MISSAILCQEALANFSRQQIALTLRARGIFSVFEKFSCAYLFQIALDIVAYTN